MRLLHTTNLSVEEVSRLANPRYAVLSHTWDETELSLQDLNSGNCRSKPGYLKIQKSCEKAKDRNTWIWIDTCCIDKSSSAELSQAINSMYQLYEDSDICYVYLGDFEDKQVSFQNLKNCKWFSRGWTLQELLAPSNVIFCNRDWTEIGSKRTLASTLSAITGIPLRVLQGSSVLHCTVAQRFSWAATRKTTRSEDIAYCLLGMFDVEMAPIYGEGSVKAFIRLQEQILKRWNDHSIFTWTPSHEPRNTGLLATSPKPFCKHRECFTWLKEVLDLSTEPFDPYEIFEPALYSSRTIAQEDGSIRPVSGSKNMHNQVSTPSLGPQGLQISLLLSDSADPDEVLDQHAPITRHIAVCLDLILKAAVGPRMGSHIILPLAVDLHRGFHSQNTSRRGHFSRFPTLLGNLAEYSLRSRCSNFQRRTFCVSQPDPIAKSEEAANFTFKALPATAKLIGSFIHAPTQQQTTVDITGPFHCRGGVFTFLHNARGQECQDIPFYIVFGMHGRKPKPWCHIATSRFATISKEEFKAPGLRLYEMAELRSTHFKASSYRLLHGRHIVRLLIAPGSHADSSLDFEITLLIFCEYGNEEDLELSAVSSDDEEDLELLAVSGDDQAKAATTSPKTGKRNCHGLDA